MGEDKSGGSASARNEPAFAAGYAAQLGAPLAGSHTCVRSPRPLQNYADTEGHDVRLTDVSEGAPLRVRCLRLSFCNGGWAGTICVRRDNLNMVSFSDHLFQDFVH